MTSTVSSDLTSSINTSQLEVPSLYQRESDFQSLRKEPPRPPDSLLLEGYEGIDWTILKGYQVPQDNFVPRVKGIYTHGWRLHHSESCHQAKRTSGSFKPVIYRCTEATSTAIGHLKKRHNIDQEGNFIKKRKLNDSNYTLTGSSEASSIENQIAVGFNHDHFKALLYDWLINDNVAFNQLDSEYLRKLFNYINPRCSRFIPCRTTASNCIAQIHDKSAGLITNTLQTAVTKINLSFDLWTSGNKLALLGLCAHFIDTAGNPVTSLLSLPKQTGRHTGLRIADTVSDIITFYGLNERLGYSTTDNASSNATCMDELAKEWSCDHNERWIRCCGHIFNLVGQSALFGRTQQLFSDEIEHMELEEQQLTLWRRKGPIGKLHNVVHWINRSPKRCERFMDYQKELIAPTRPVDKKESYQLITDVTTRWNSFYDSATRAVYLKPAIEAIMDEEIAAYDKQVRQAGLNPRKPQPKRPSILDDVLSAVDWSVISQYLSVLKPLKDATMRLQGHAGGKSGSIWRVIPVFEELMRHFEEQAALHLIRAVVRPDSHSSNSLPSNEPAVDDTIELEDHFSINIDLAWTKLNQYYTKLDNSPIYVAAVVLHPRFKWRWIEQAWKERPDWINGARQSFSQLINQYRYWQPPEDEQSLPKRPRLDIDVTTDYPSDEEGDEEGDIDQQLASYRKDSTYRHLDILPTTSPIPYWLGKRSIWPQLAALALQVNSIAVMSDEPERVFSIAGATVTPRRRALADSSINNLMVLKAWSKAGLIKLDRYLTTFTYKH